MPLILGYKTKFHIPNMKKIIPGILLISSLTFAGLIIFNSPELPNTNIQKSQITNEIKTTRVEALNHSLSENQQTRTQTQANATQKVIEKIAHEIVTEPQLTDIDPNQLIGRVFEEGIANFDIKSIRPEVNLFSLNIGSENNQQAIKTYAQNFKKIVAENTLYSTTDNKKATLEDLNFLLISYKEILPELYKLAVPPSVATIHRDGIIVLETQKNILEKLVNAEQDPVAAILAMKLIPEVNQEIINFFQNKLGEL